MISRQISRSSLRKIFLDFCILGELCNIARSYQYGTLLQRGNLGPDLLLHKESRLQYNLNTNQLEILGLLFRGGSMVKDVLLINVQQNIAKTSRKSLNYN